MEFKIWFWNQIWCSCSKFRLQRVYTSFLRPDFYKRWKVESTKSFLFGTKFCGIYIIIFFYFILLCKLEIKLWIQHFYKTKKTLIPQFFVQKLVLLWIYIFQMLTKFCNFKNKITKIRCKNKVSILYLIMKL